MMFVVNTLNKIASCGLDCFDKTLYSIGDNQENPDAIILRSTSMHDMELPKSLKAIARAGAGVNNIPIDKCSENGIVVFNTPGANANAVKELTLCGLFLASRKVTAGCEWVKTLTDEIPKAVEKGKSDFAGPEVEGKRIAVIGLGAIGVMVANACYHLGMDVVGYDPYITVKSALGLSRYIKVSGDLKSVLESADYVTLHVPLCDSTRNMLTTATFESMKDGARVLNFSRAELVDDDAMKIALDSGKVGAYVTDFPNAKTVTMKNCVCIPHLGASTPESEDNCAVMASRELIDFLELGNITNSVNFPNVELPRGTGSRVTVAHRNIPNMISQYSSVMAQAQVNIDDMLNRSCKDYAYTIIETAVKIDDSIADKLMAIDGVLAVRLINNG